MAFSLFAFVGARVIEPTLTLRQSAEKIWDAAVIGAGPAGAMTAYELARKGFSVLLIDKASFPRYKVCGGCLNFASLRLLKAAGLGNLVWDLGAKPLRKIHLARGNQKAEFAIPLGASLSREKFDAALIQQAIGRGAHFLPKTAAFVPYPFEEIPAVKITQGSEETRVRTRQVIVSDGLAGSALPKYSDFEFQCEAETFLGLGAVALTAPDFYSEGKIFMTCSAEGYAGLVRLEDGRLNLAAAVKKSFVSLCGSPEKAVTQLLRDSAWEMPGVKLDWHGTLPLNRFRSQTAASRLFVLGDAAGYGEPFTGEGMAIALASASALARCLTFKNSEEHWARWQNEKIGPIQKRCSRITAGLRQNWISSNTFRFLSWSPLSGTWFVKGMQKNLTFQN